MPELQVLGSSHEGRRPRPAVRRRARTEPSSDAHPTTRDQPLRAPTWGRWMQPGGGPPPPPPFEDALEQSPLPTRTPQLEINLSARVHVYPYPVVADLHVDAFDGALVPTVEAVGQAQQGGQLGDALLTLGRQRAERLMGGLGFGVAVVARDGGEGLHLFGGEPSKLSVFDEVGGVLVVARRRNVLADVVHEPGIFEQLAVDTRQAVEGQRAIEEVASELR